MVVWLSNKLSQKAETWKSPKDTPVRIDVKLVAGSV